MSPNPKLNHQVWCKNVTGGLNMLFVLHQCSRLCLWPQQQTANSQQNSVQQSQTTQRAAVWSYYPFNRQSCNVGPPSRTEFACRLRCITGPSFPSFCFPPQLASEKAANQGLLSQGSFATESYSVGLLSTS